MTNKDDLISREAALACFHDWIDKNGDLHTPDEMAEYRAIEGLPGVENANQEVKKSNDCISRQEAIDALMEILDRPNHAEFLYTDEICGVLRRLPSVQPDLGKYEYHYDHTDCIWYRPEARNRCPVTCAQYRDGWNDAMNYIFRDGKGYRPYRRGEQYEE